jgi:hypothetical protein
MNIGMDYAIGGRQNRPRRARPPGRDWRLLAERNSGERALGDRHERCLRVWQIGAECLMKPSGIDGELGATIRQRGGLVYGPTTAAGNLDWNSTMTSPSSGAIPATYTSPTTLFATPDAVMTAPPYEWATSSTGPSTCSITHFIYSASSTVTPHNGFGGALIVSPSPASSARPRTLREPG